MEQNARHSDGAQFFDGHDPFAGHDVRPASRGLRAMMT
jgi:hypothetical protein